MPGLGREAMSNLESLLKKQRHQFANKVCIVKAMVFPVVMYGCQSWDHKESRMPKNRCLQTVVLKKTLESSLDSKEIIPVNLKGNSEYSLEGLMLKLKLQYFGYLIRRVTHWKRPWCWERLRAGGEGDNRGWDGWMASLMQWTWTCANSGRWWGTGRPGVVQSMGSWRVRCDWATE